MADVHLAQLIVATPGIRGGRPRVARAGVSVAAIAAYWKEGHQAEAISTEIFPELGLDEAHAALAYYFANRAAIDDELAAGDAASDTARSTG